MSVKFITRDRGFSRWLQDLSKRGTVEVGVLGAKAQAPSKSATRKAKDNARTVRAGISGRGSKKQREALKRGTAMRLARAPSVATIASHNEFGYTPPGYKKPTNPKRPFIRGWFDSNKGRQELVKMQRALGARRVKNLETIETSLKKLGVFAVGKIKKYIADGVPPPNAQVTIDRKGSSKPLIATGQMRNSITYRVNKNV